MPRVVDFLDEFVSELEYELLKGEEKWGDEWLSRSRSGQTERILDTFDTYYHKWLERGGDFPWLSVAGNAMIAWIRDSYPELSKAWQDDDLDNL